MTASTATDQSPAPYRGRFAPSPTGPLHLGSLIAALGSYLDAKARQGLWLLRMEDLDPPREQPGAADAILQMLEAHGLDWDGPVLYQSQRHDAYRDALQALLIRRQAFYCSCSRADIQQQGGIYPGHCRQQTQAPTTPFAIRLRVNEQTIAFNDRLQGLYTQQLASDVGDFVLQRKDGFYAYQLAVVVDDAEQNINHIVRGSDLLDSTPRQIFLQQQLGLPTPSYLHLPILVNADGQKLSKQTFAEPLQARRALANLQTALRFLQQPVEPADSIAALLAHAIKNWQPERICQTLAISEKTLSHSR